MGNAVPWPHMADLRLAGVLIHTSADRFAALRAFYVEQLGLTPRSDREGFTNFEWGPVRLTLHVHSDVAGDAAEPRRVMINLASSDIEGDVARLAASGTPVLRPPQREAWGGRVATLVDPDGNLVQLLELPGS